MNAPAVGEVIEGKYRVDRVLGQGGMGIVLAATHLHLDSPVALKCLLPEATQSADALARFIQ
jgi:serine/threonine protein kinase